MDSAASFARRLQELTPVEGITPSALPGLIFYRADAPAPREPMIFGSSLCVVAAGTKRAFLDSEVLTYDPLNYLVLSVPLPLDCEITTASPEEPFLSLVLDIDPSQLSELLLEMDEPPRASQGPKLTRGIYTSRIDDGMLDAVTRLLDCLDDPHRTRILAPMAVREILYRLLIGEQGHLLRAMAFQDSRSHRIARLLRLIRERYREPLDVPAMAGSVHMSISAFHESFRAVTGMTPIQYLKLTRLHQARLFMLHDSVSAATAAARIGYRSASQFSRDFSRFFGAPPAEYIRRLGTREESRTA